MPIEVQKVKAATATVPFQYDGDEATITYKRGAASPQWYNDLFSVPAKVKLAQIIDTWSVTNGGEPYTPAEASVEAWEALLDTLPQPLLAEALQAVIEDLRPGDKAKK